MMAVNHISSDLQVVTNHVFGFVSAAEGFVFLSGLMSGWMYTRQYYTSGTAKMKETAVRRASGLYVFHLATYVTVLLGVSFYTAWFGIAPAIAPSAMVDHPWLSLLSGIVLLQQPSLFDILPMYCVLLLAVPVLVLACSRGQPQAVLIGSSLLWLLANLFSPQAPVIKGVINTGSFNLLGWQLLFVTGVVFGHAWASGRRLWPRPHAWLITGAFAAAGLFFAVRHAFVQLPLSGAALDWWTNKNNVAPLRLLNTALLYYLVYVIAVRFPRSLAWRPLVFLGQHSMVVFAAHILVAYTLLAFPQLFAQSPLHRAVGTIVMIGSLFAVAAYHQSLRDRARRQLRGFDSTLARQS